MHLKGLKVNTNENELNNAKARAVEQGAELKNEVVA